MIKSNLPKLERSFLEESIDRMEESLDPIKTFVLPGGHPTVSYCHISRCVCRRAERICVKLSEINKVEEFVIQYLNRLSDYLFVFSRHLTKILNVKETPWVPEKS